MEAVFLKVLNMSIAASWLILAVVLLRVLLKKAPKAIHCALWALVAVRLLCPISIESDLSLVPSAETVPEEIFYAQEPEIHTGIASVNALVNPIITETFAPDPMASVNPIQVQMWIWGMIWVMGAAVLLLYAVISYWRLRRKVWAAVRWEEDVWQSEQVSSPFILGIVNPRIYLPFHMEAEQMKYVLAHERAHLKRRDHWWKPLGFFLLAVYWFNPLIWAAYILLCRDIELACDERVIRDMGGQEKKHYSEALLTCSVPRRMVAACPLAFGEVGVKTRIKSVLNYKKPAFWVMAVGLAASAVLAVCFLTDPDAVDGKITVDGVLYYQQTEVKKDGLPVGSREIGRLLGLETDEKGDPARDFHGTGLKEKYVGLPIFRDGTRGEVIYLVVGNGAITFASEEQAAIPGSRMTLDDVRELAQKGEALTWQDFEDFFCSETGSGLYIRVYEIDEMFSLRIGGAGPQSVPMYISLTASDGLDEQIDIRTGDVEAFIAGHKDNPLVVDCSYSWQCSPVGYEEGMFQKMLELRGGVTGLNLSSIQASPAVQIRSREELENFAAALEKTLDFDKSYGDASAFSETMPQYDDGWFESRALFLIYLTADQVEDRFAIEHVRKSEGLLSIAIQEQVADLSEPVKEGWLMAVGIPKEELKDIHRTMAFISSRTVLEAPLSAAIREAVMAEFQMDVPKNLYAVESHQVLDMTRAPYVHPVTGEKSIHITVYALILEQAYSIDRNGGLVSEAYGGHCPRALTFEVTENGEYLLKEYWRPMDGAYYIKDIKEKFPPAAAEEALKLKEYIYPQMQDCYHQMIEASGIDPNAAIKALLDEVERHAPDTLEGSADAVAEFAPLDVYRELLYYGGYTIEHIREEQAAGGYSVWREKIMEAVRQDIIRSAGVHGNPIFLMTYEATPEEEVAEKIKNGELVITTTHHQLGDGTWKTEQYTYKYRLEITGRMNNAARDSTYIVLSNTDDITFDQAWKASGLSSNLDDYFDPVNAKIVGFK